MLRARRANIGRPTCNANDVALLRRSQIADTRAQVNTPQRECNERNRSVDPIPVVNLALRSRIRRAILAETMLAAFNYHSQIDYSMYGYIGLMAAICPHCDPAIFQGETHGMCCANDTMMEAASIKNSTRTIVFINLWDISNVEAFFD